MYWMIHGNRCVWSGWHVESFYICLPQRYLSLECNQWEERKKKNLCFWQTWLSSCSIYSFMSVWVFTAGSHPQVGRSICQFLLLRVDQFGGWTASYCVAPSDAANKSVLMQNLRQWQAYKYGRACVLLTSLLHTYSKAPSSMKNQLLPARLITIIIISSSNSINEY